MRLTLHSLSVSVMQDKQVYYFISHSKKEGVKCLHMARVQYSEILKESLHWNVG